MTSTADMQPYINMVRQAPAQLEAMLAPLTPDQLYYGPAGQWTVLQNLHHLADSHIQGFIRLKLTQTEHIPTIRPFEQDDLAALPQARYGSVQAGLNILRGLHARWATFGETRAEADWARKMYHPQRKAFLSLADVYAYFAKHTQLHLTQISEALASGNKQDSAPVAALSRPDLAESIAEFEAYPATLEALVSPLSEVELAYHPQGEWTVRQNVHHLADSHMNGYTRVLASLCEDGPIIRPYLQANWAALPDAESLPIAHSLEILHGLHAQFGLLLRSLTPAQWGRPYYHPDNRELVDVEGFLAAYIKHGKAHIKQINEALQAGRAG
jgi:hypothetical protein